MAFGDNSFGDSKPRVGQRGRGNRGGLGGGGGNRNRRNRNRNQGGGGGGGDGDSPSTPNPFDTGDVSAGDPFDSAFNRPGYDATFGGAGSILEDPDSAGGESWRTNAWGLLNQGGITQDSAFGGQQVDWLEGQLQDWYDQWQGQGALAGDDAASWVDFVAGVPGTPPPGSGPATTNTGPAWMGPDYQLPEWARTSTPGATGVNLDYLRNQWGPSMRQFLTARYQSQTPRGRGTQSSAWTGPRRVIQFLVTLASAGAIVAEFAAKAIGG